MGVTIGLIHHRVSDQGRSSRPWDGGWGGGGERTRPQKKFFFRPFGPHFGLKVKGAPPPPPPGPFPGSATEGCCTLATNPYGFEHKCARNLSVQAVLTTSALLAFIAIANWAQQPYLFRTIQSIQTTLPSQRCYKNVFYYLDNFKTPFQLTIEDVKTTGHILLK